MDAVEASLKCAILLASGVWLGWWLLSPELHILRENENHVDGVSLHVNSTFLRTGGRQGSIFIFQAVPLMLLAVLSFCLIGWRRQKQHGRRRTGGQSVSGHLDGRPCVRLGTYPLWVGSPLGILTAAEVLFLGCLLFVVCYHLGRRIQLDFHKIDSLGSLNGHHPLHHQAPKPWQKIKRIAFHSGNTALLTFSLLWLPVSRGSPFLRLIQVPFEKAVKYHIWLATLMMFLLTIHGIGHMLFYIIDHRGNQIYQWATKDYKSAMVAGLIAWIIGLIISITSLPYFRRRMYELFYVAHHLYVLFFAFWLYHAIWSYHFFIVPVLLFFVDRFIRMIQSRQVVDVLSANVLESGAMELKFLKKDKEDWICGPTSWCIQIPIISKVQWHFFTGLITPIDGNTKQVSITIKPLGDWSKTLLSALKDMQTKYMQHKCLFSLKARVEGPYLDESKFYLRYKTLVLISGGIGITPLLATIQDILERYKAKEQKSTPLPRNITVYHCIRSPKEICVLNNMNPNAILPNYDSLGLDIQVHVYITSTMPQNYDGSYSSQASIIDLSTIDVSNINVPYQDSTSEFYLEKTLKEISNISTFSNTMWVACITISSIIGYLLILGLMNMFLISHNNVTNYNHVHLIILSMVLGVLIFGGIMVAAWRHDLRAQSKHLASIQPRNNSATSSPCTYQINALRNIEENIGLKGGSPWIGDLHVFSRPNWKDVFNGLAMQYKGENVGVLVSGSHGMQEDIARECRRHSNLLHMKDNINESTVFHFHSISFEL